MKKLLLFLFLAPACIYATERLSIDTITISEKVYLHTDRSMYQAGDTIWFKGYLVDRQNRFTESSGVLYVELISSQLQIITAVKVPLTAGIGWADIPLPDTLNSGSYRLRAYTSWMRNQGEESFFEKPIAISSLFNDMTAAKASFDAENNKVVARLQYHSLEGSPHQQKKVSWQMMEGDKVVKRGSGSTGTEGELRVTLDERSKALQTLVTHLALENETVTRSFVVPAAGGDFDVHFFPEGGNLVSGLPSRVAFKVLGIDGLGLAATGYIEDNKGARIAELKTDFAGMGLVGLNPQAGRTYRAYLRTEGGLEKTLDLPPALSQGYVMTVSSDERQVSVRVRASEGLPDHPMTIKVESQGKQLASTTLMLVRGQILSLAAKDDLPRGIATLTLLTAEDKPVAERLVFIDHSDLVNIYVDSLDESYATRSKVTPRVFVRDKSGKPVIAHLSMSVVDEGKVPYDEQNETNILSNLLLRSELRGYVEKPNFYFPDNGPVRQKELDLLMLTQGWRRFLPSEKITTSRSPTFAPEKAIVIRGRVVSGFNIPQVGAEVSMLVPGVQGLQRVYTDSNGEFAFDSLYFENQPRLTLSAKTVKGSSNVHIVLDSVVRPIILPARRENVPASDIQEFELATSLDSSEVSYLKQRFSLNEVQKLSEVVVRATRGRKVQNSSNLNQRESIFSFVEKEYDKYDKLSEFITARIPGTRAVWLGDVTVILLQRKMMIKISGPPRPMWVYVDGVPTSNDVNMFNLRDYEGVEVLTQDNELSVYGEQGAGGIILLTSKTGATKAESQMGSLSVELQGFAPDREFYSPRYDRPGLSRDNRDVRSTVYWNPDIFTIGGVDSLSSFFTAQDPGVYRFVIEGLDEFGRPLRRVFRKQIISSAGDLFSRPAAIKSNFQIKSSDIPMREKLHMHLDRPFYNAGDTIWFKGYLVDAENKLNDHSGVLYVDLISPTDQLIETLKIPLTAGLGWGHIPLSDQLSGGNYRIRAYTSWMRNFGEEYFFEKPVPISDILSRQLSSTVRYQYSGKTLVADMRFRDIEGRPLAGKEVRYSIPRSDRRIINGRGQTDGNGQMLLHLDTSGIAMSTLTTAIKIEQDTVFKTSTIPLLVNEFDLQFFPEGGELIEGILSRVGFKVLGKGGVGLTATGKVVDDSGEVIATFATGFAGMGSFEIKPEAGKTLFAKVSLASGMNKRVPLPVAKSQGYVLSVKQDKDALLVTVQSTQAGGQHQLKIAAQGRIVHSGEINLIGGRGSSRVPKAGLVSGINVVTLLQDDSTPLAERVVFVHRQDSIAIHIDSPAGDFKTKSRMAIGVGVSNATPGRSAANFSLSVIDHGKVPFDENDETTIFSNLLLSSELQGYVEKPNYYFTNINEDKEAHLDNLMLTQGWRKFEWKPVAGVDLKFAAESGLSVKGKTLSPLSAPVPGAAVSLLVQQEGERFRTATTGTDGSFHFDSLNFYNRTKMVLAASKENGRANMRINIDTSDVIPVVSPWRLTVPEYLNSIDSAILARKDDDFAESMRYHVNLNKVQQLAEVTVRATRRIPYSKVLIYGAPFTFERKNLDKFPTIQEMITTIGVPGVRFDALGNAKAFGRAGWTDMSYQLDGIPIDMQEFHSLGPQDVEAVEVVTNAVSANVLGGKVARVILLTSRKGGPRTPPRELGQLEFFARGFQPVRQFYSPRYDRPSTTEPVDLRTTIYWNPNIMSINGKSSEVHFFTAPKPGLYRFTIEGIDQEGRLGRKVFLREVK